MSKDKNVIVNNYFNKGEVGNTPLPEDFRGSRWPWPFPWPLPFPPCPFPFPWPFPGGPLLKPGNPNLDLEIGLFKRVASGLNLKRSPEFKKKETRNYLRKEVLPKLMVSESLEEVDEIMEKAYKMYPGFKEVVRATYDDIKSKGDDFPPIQGIPIIVWVIRVIITIIIILVASNDAD